MKSDQGLIFYYREGCHLCEDMNEQLQAAISGYSIDLVYRNVDKKSEWLNLYHDKVPVLLYGEEIIAQYYLDVETLLRILDEQSSAE